MKCDAGVNDNPCHNAQPLSIDQVIASLLTNVLKQTEEYTTLNRTVNGGKIVVNQPMDEISYIKVTFDCFPRYCVVFQWDDIGLIRTKRQIYARLYRCEKLARVPSLIEDHW